MNTVMINLDALQEAAVLLLGPQGALRLAAVYATIEKVQKAAYETGFADGVEDERLAADPEVDFNELQEAARAFEERWDHQDDHYDVWHARFHRAGEDE